MMKNSLTRRRQGERNGTGRRVKGGKYHSKPTKDI
jgi:hypothetical protein